MYFITDRRRMGRRFINVVRGAARGGAFMIQVREKDLADGALLALTKRVAREAKPWGAKVLVNGRMDVAALAGADGAHLGKTTIPVKAARRAMGKNFLLGYSAHSIREAKRAERDGADFITFGPVFASRDKRKGSPKGASGLRRAAGALRVPVYALGGISIENVEELKGTGIHGVAAISAVAEAASPARAVRALRSSLAARRQTTRIQNARASKRAR